MTHVEARCPTCGHLQLPLTAIRVWTTPGHGGLLAFGCPTCQQLALLHISDRSLAALHQLGVPMAPVGQTPTELHSHRPTPTQSHSNVPPHPEPPPDPQAEALTEDDVIAFGLMLREEDWYDRLVTADR